MKKISAVFWAYAILFAPSAWGQSDPVIPADVLRQADAAVSEMTGGSGKAGGWTKQNSAQILIEDRVAFEKAVASQNAEYSPLILEATQVVAGLNYCFLCEVKKDGKTEYQLICIYRDLQGNAVITDAVKLGK